jgi:hypothetical protein
VNDFRGRARAQLGAAVSRLAEGTAQAEFRARLGVALTEALTELRRARQARSAVAPPDAGRGDRGLRARLGGWAPWRPRPDFRARLGVELTAPARTLAAQRDAFGANARASAARARLAGWARTAPGADFRCRLGMQLAASAAALAGARAQGRAAARSGRRMLAPWLARPLAVVFALTVLAGAATASSLWLVTVGNPNGGVNPGLSATSPPAAQLAALAVLRRAPTAADRGSAVQSDLEDVNEFATGVRSDYVRVLETTSDGPVVLVPVVRRDPTPAGSPSTSAAGAIDDALCVYYPVHGAGALGSSPACWSTEQVLAGTAVSSANGRVFGLAPDGVRSVSISVAGSSAPVAAPVADNFFDAPLPATGTPAAGGAPLPPSTPVVTFHGG